MDSIEEMQSSKSDDQVRAQAEVASNELLSLATSTTSEASAVVEQEDPNMIKAGVGNFASVTKAERLGNGVLRVTEHATVSPTLPKTTEMGFDIRPISNISQTRTTESIAHPDGILGKLRAIPDMETAVKTRVTTVTERGIDPQKGRYNSEVTFHEDASGEQRDVTRTVDVGTDKEGKPVITVNQVSTDKRGENPRERTWTHTEEKPSEVALRTAQGISKRVASKQPKQVDTEIRL